MLCLQILNVMYALGVRRQDVVGAVVLKSKEMT